MGFRKDFYWGAATSAYQIEGAFDADGKGPSIWDKFVHQGGNCIVDGHVGDVACDHYHHYKEDVALMAKMGLKAYRFSISWPRVIPDGVGRVNPAGIRFYSDLVDELLAHGIEPYVTLYHWDLPYALHTKGGWLNEECIDWFSQYAKVVVEALSDRVKYFFTFNEPQCFIGASYELGYHAPGYQMSMFDTLLISHNVMRAHGAAVRVMREAAKQDLVIGYAPTGSMDYPATDSPEDIKAARASIFSIPDIAPDVQWTWNVPWWTDPVYLGHYPEEGLRKYHKFLPTITKEDMKLIHQPLDMMGYNIYNGAAVRAGENGKPEPLLPRPVGHDQTGNGWPITPECLYWGPKFLQERYPNLPIAITENGLSLPDVVSQDGKVHDPNRIDFMSRYLKNLRRAADDGVDISGYFAWSLMDNFEWTYGYKHRFGMIYVNFKTQERILKDSAYWYRDVIAHNGENL